MAPMRCGSCGGLSRRSSNPSFSHWLDDGPSSRRAIDFQQAWGNGLHCAPPAPLRARVVASCSGASFRRRSHSMASESTQVAVLGAGPGGYAAAFYAADLGMQVALIDEEKNPGGVCLYRGCIPSKALLHVAKVIDEARHAGNWGVTFGEPTDRRRQAPLLQAGRRRQADGGRGQRGEASQGEVPAGPRDVDGPDVVEGRGRRRRDGAAVRAPDSRDRIASDAGAVAVARQSPHDGLDVGARSAGCPEVAARRRWRLHRPRTGDRLRDARAARCPWWR